MIERYTRPEMGVLWDLEHRFGKMLEVEVAVATVQANLNIIPKKAAIEIRKKSKFSVKKIAEIEKTTHHDVIAFVTNVASNVGDSGKYIHFAMTSSDILDTAFSLQVREAGELLCVGIVKLQTTLKRIIKEHQGTMCAGRTHGMFAEPTTFGLKMAGFFAELERNKNRIERALAQMAICKLSGAVGTYSSQSPTVEKKVASLLKLTPETVATQVIPRDRHAEMIWSLSMLASGLERLSIELRHLQRSEVSEVVEGFQPGQKGSSAMPHKKNPISAENITGASRLLRGYAQSTFENIALWHERDISHSSVERVVFPDAFILTDYIVHRMDRLLSGLYVNKERMQKNMDSSQGQLFSSHLLLALVQKGLSREEAYSHVQRVSHSLKEGEHLKIKAMNDNEIKKILTKLEIENIFQGEKYKKNVDTILKRLKKVSTVSKKRKVHKK